MTPILEAIEARFAYCAATYAVALVDTAGSGLNEPWALFVWNVDEGIYKGKAKEISNLADLPRMTLSALNRMGADKGSVMQFDLLATTQKASERGGAALDSAIERLKTAGVCA